MTCAEPLDLLAPENVIRYLSARGVIDAKGATITTLSGGISNTVIAVTEKSPAVVVKQSLPRLRVADDWPAPRSRTLAEAAALDLVGRISPGNVPRVLDRDPTRFVVVIESAPAAWSDWKALLLRQAIEPRIAKKLGALLAQWHSATFGDPSLPSYFSDPSAFERASGRSLLPYDRATQSGICEARRASDRAHARSTIVPCARRLLTKECACWAVARSVGNRLRGWTHR